MRIVHGWRLTLFLAIASCAGDEFTSHSAAGPDGGGAAGSGAGAGGSAALGGAAGSGGIAGSGGSAGASGADAGPQGGSAGAMGGNGGATGGSAGAPTCLLNGPKPAPTWGEEVLAITGDTQPEYPVVDQTHVYWTTKTALWRIEKTGACLQKVADGGTDLESVVLDGGFAYVADIAAGKAYRVPLAGGTFELLIENQGPLPTIAVDATHLYWCREGSGIGRKLKDGTGSWTAVVTGEPFAKCFAIAVDADYLFVATRNGILARAAKESPHDPKTLDSVPGVSSSDPAYITLYENRVYWTHWLAASGDASDAASGAASGASGGIRSVSKEGSNLVSLSQVHPEGIAVDKNGAWWALSDSPGGIIRKGLPSLTTATDHVIMQLRPRGIAIDATHVYWVNGDDSTLRRTPR